MDSDSWPLLILFFCMLAGSAFFSATETAFLALNRIRVKSMAEDGDVRAHRALIVSAHMDRALSTILVGNNILNIGSAAVATVFAARAWGAAGVAISTVSVTVLVFLFGELIPKRYARDNAESFALSVSGVLAFLMKALRPLTFAFDKLTAWLSRRFPAPDEPSYTEEELHDIIETIEDEGVLEPDQQELVQSAYEFGETVARDIMTPIDKVRCVDSDMTPQSVLALIDEDGYSRYPVRDGKSGRILGMLHTGRFLAGMLAGAPIDLRALLLPLRSYAPNTHIDDLMRDMNRHRAHMALIVGDDGKPLGVATMEDILEELVGEIYDEGDVEAPEGDARGAAAKIPLGKRLAKARPKEPAPLKAGEVRS